LCPTNSEHSSVVYPARQIANAPTPEGLGIDLNAFAGSQNPTSSCRKGDGIDLRRTLAAMELLLEIRFVEKD
jgi:hypothetical protein